MGWGLRKLLIAVLLFVVGSIADNLMTYWLVVVRGDFFEANPFTAPFIYSQPLYMWFVRDFAFLTLIIAASLGYKQLMLYLSRNDPLSRRARIIRIASRYWVIVLTVAAVRLLPAIHNVLVVATGYESPLSLFPIYMFNLLGR